MGIKAGGVDNLAVFLLVRPVTIIYAMIPVIAGLEKLGVGQRPRGRVPPRQHLTRAVNQPGIHYRGPGWLRQELGMTGDLEG